MVDKRGNISETGLINLDVQNTLNGGHSLSTMNIHPREDHYEMFVDIPGVDIKDLRVEVKDNQLHIYHLMSVANDTDNKQKVPRLVSVHALPREVALQDISAHYEDKKLVIKLPLNDLADGYHKLVDISHN